MSGKPVSVTRILSKHALDTLRASYDEKAMTQVLCKPLPKIDPDPRFRSYVRAVRHAFYFPAARPTASDLQAIDRERILIALLAARGLRYELALHVYAGLMHGASPAHVANVVFLTGIYAGVPCVANGLAVLETLLLALKDRVTRAQPLDAKSIAAALRTVFAP